MLAFQYLSRNIVLKPLRVGSKTPDVPVSTWLVAKLSLPEFVE